MPRKLILGEFGVHSAPVKGGGTAWWADFYDGTGPTTGYSKKEAVILGLRRVAAAAKRRGNTKQEMRAIRMIRKVQAMKNPRRSLTAYQVAQEARWELGWDNANEGRQEPRHPRDSTYMKGWNTRKAGEHWDGTPVKGNPASVSNDRWTLRLKALQKEADGKIVLWLLNRLGLESIVRVTSPYGGADLDFRYCRTDSEWQHQALLRQKALAKLTGIKGILINKIGALMSQGGQPNTRNLLVVLSFLARGQQRARVGDGVKETWLDTLITAIERNHYGWSFAPRSTGSTGGSWFSETNPASHLVWGIEAVITTRSKTELRRHPAVINLIKFLKSIPENQQSVHINVGFPKWNIRGKFTAKAHAATFAKLVQAFPGTVRLQYLNLANNPRKAAAKAKFLVHLSHGPNPDLQYSGGYSSGYWGDTPAEGAKNVEVSTLADASDVVLAYIGRNGLGGGNWTGGQVIKGGKVVARISYNGRIWGADGSEIVPESRKPR
jgi:hypothetical protein